MSVRLLFIGCLAILFLATASALEDSTAGKMQQHINRLDAKITQMEEKHELREAELVIKIGQLETRVSSLEANIVALTKTNYRHKEKSRKQTRKQILQKWTRDQNANDGQEINRNKKKVIANKIRQRNVELRDADVQKPVRALDRTLNIAFSAYLDHDENNLGAKETLVFNQILLNEGNSYSKYTGVFTVPTPGVYSFTYFIGQRHTNQLYTALYVNNVNKVDAVVQTDGTDEDAQGGNSVLLKLSAGDAVYVRKIASGIHVEGDPTKKFTTFSGFLLYPTEDGSTIVGK